MALILPSSSSPKNTSSVNSVAKPMLKVHFKSSQDDVNSSNHGATTASSRAKDTETLKEFSRTFSLLVPPPLDIIPILTKNPAKQELLRAQAEEAALVHEHPLER
ncbi:hypothetical protein B2J93_7597 [Marssonina coronariae]|uniref:Uncharacterized protein n=1 Tax=Diplocarpon coronariae TaxID=2795749 RepID=A0A218Z688_9HELO|nr:hypothetical protein JHW43_004226 [Diplocarpon mali]OWP03579.1 hypothetical protein B2J93_7597 [Marssonina coronariae]